MRTQDDLAYHFGALGLSFVAFTRVGKDFTISGAQPPSPLVLGISVNVKSHKETVLRTMKVKDDTSSSLADKTF